MRLLNTSTLKLSYFAGSVPPYAILSHTWGPEEVLFEDIQIGAGTSKCGFKKLVGCCKKAAADGFEWVWIDTCCIDKSSSAELSEAINSMYQWYKDSVICYAYLEDISELETSADHHLLVPHQFTKSRWFTRGWTLQELIAPRILEFYNAGWVEIGTKASLSGLVSKITGVPTPVLRGEDPSSCTVAHRMSWASTRQTTREEDIAYCLLGIFEVNMPMLYGEGRKAFRRLQEEIMKQNEDYTLFAWSLQYDCSPFLTGILASSPADFSKFVPANMRKPTLHYHSDKLNHINILLRKDNPDLVTHREEVAAEIQKITDSMVDDPVPRLPYQVLYKRMYDCMTYLNPQSSLAKNKLPRKLAATLLTSQDPFQQTSRGIRMRLPLKISTNPSIPSIAWIYCFQDCHPVCIFIERLESSTNSFARQNSSSLVNVNIQELTEFKVEEIYMHPAGVLGTSGTQTIVSEKSWGRIRMVDQENGGNITATSVAVYPRNWNLDEMFFNGQPDIFGAITFECMFQNEVLSFAVIIGQHKGAPWCEAHSPNTGVLLRPFADSYVKSEGEFEGVGVLKALVANANERKDFVEASDRSTVVFQGIEFSAALRRNPSPHHLTTVYTLRTSARTVHAQQ